MDAIISIDDSQRVVLFDAAAERMFGCTSAEALGQPLERFIPARLRAAHRAHVSAFWAGNPGKGTTVVVRIPIQGSTHENSDC